MKLSAIIIAKNEQMHIVDCLNSVTFVDEIIVIDDYSNDETKTLAEEHGAKVYQRAMNGDFAAQRDFAISKSHGEWLLFIDCDERITPMLADEIQQVIAGAPIAYRIRRLNHFSGYPVRYGTLRPDAVCRLLPNQDIHFEGAVHEKVVHDFTEKTLKTPMLHFTYDSWTQYYQKFEQYTRIAAQQYAERGKQVNTFRDFLLRPLWAFLKMYIIHGGFLDGKIGWVLAVNHYHYTLTKYSRLYAIQQFGEDAR